VVAAGLIGSVAGSASAGETGRNCKTFYAGGDPSSSWGFTVCVKLVHEPADHIWYATASVSSTTPGISLQISKIVMTYSTGGSVNLDSGTLRGAGTSFVSASTGLINCHGAVTLGGTATGYAYWPNGVRSSDGKVDTAPASINATC
jgi:hypothetical protein